MSHTMSGHRVQSLHGPRVRWARGARVGLVVLATLPAMAIAATEGDATRGAKAYVARCGGCHSVDADRIGPQHAGVFGRRAGSVAGFDYSPALKASRVVWTTKTLDQWLVDPDALIPGQRMGYRLDDAATRADIIAFLVTLRRK